MIPYWEDMKIGWSRFTTLAMWVCAILAPLGFAYMMFAAGWYAFDGDWLGMLKYCGLSLGYVYMWALSWLQIYKRRQARKENNSERER